MFKQVVIIHYTVVVVCGKTVLKGIVIMNTYVVCMYIRVLFYRKSFDIKYLIFRVFTGSSGRERTERRFQCTEFRYICCG